jgi:drug/metabolite transporter (DMT)-like permease
MQKPITGTRPPAAMPAGTGVLFAQMLACSLLWASAFLLMKAIGTDLSPLALTAARGIMGGGLLALWVLVRGGLPWPRGREWRDWIILGIAQGVVPNTLTAYALTEITAGLTALIQASTPLMVAVLAHALFADERLGGRRAAGVLTGFAGMAVLIGPAAFLDGSGLDGSGSLPGTLAMVATAVSYAIGNVYVRSIPDPQPLRLAFGQQTFSGVPALALALAAGGPAAFAAVPGHAAVLAALGLFATALPIVLYMNVLRIAGPTLGSMNGYLVPIWTILLGFALLGETVGLREVAGGLVVLAGVAIASRARRPAGR